MKKIIPNTELWVSKFNKKMVGYEGKKVLEKSKAGGVPCKIMEVSKIKKSLIGHLQPLWKMELKKPLNTEYYERNY